MKSNRKRSKVARTTTSVKPKEDRLSSLLDSVLCHILSFLPTKYAAITSVLSARWRYLSLGVPKIDLDESLLLNPRSRTDENHDFIDFVNRRLMLCKTPAITEFRLKCQSFPRAPVINLWLTTLLFRDVKVLEIEVESWENPPLCLPIGIFRSETLVVLKLAGGKIVVRIPEFVSFRNLKILDLKNVDMQFESDNNFRLAEEGYPLLEELRLEGIRFPENKEKKATLGISIRTLKVLAIIRLNDEFSRIDIETPHLQHLKCQFLWISIPKMVINFCRCDSLISADISCEKCRSFHPWLLKLLSNVNNVKELRIVESFLWDVRLRVYSLPQFPNLTYLELTAFVEAESVWSLLQLAPNLKTLVCDAVRFGEDFLPPENEPLCFVQTLTEIRITGFEEIDEVFAAIRFFLEHAAVLEKMIIVVEPDRVVDWTAFNQLLKQRRCSPKCEIEFIHLGDTCPIYFDRSW